jgi:hypothetical protein
MVAYSIQVLRRSTNSQQVDDLRIDEMTLNFRRIRVVRFRDHETMHARLRTGRPVAFFTLRPRECGGV